MIFKRNVFDACAGQFDGDFSSTSYLKTAIDHSTAEEKDLSYYTSMILPNFFSVWENG